MPGLAQHAIQDRPVADPPALTLARGALLNALLTVSTVAHETDLGTIRAHLSGLRDALRETLDVLGEVA